MTEPLQGTLPDVTLSTFQEGDGAPVVVVDFVRFSGERTAADLVAATYPGRRVLRADPVADLTPLSHDVELTDLAEAYARRVLAEAPETALVVGYCSAAPLALLVCQQLRTRRDVPALLVAPGFPVAEHVLEDIAEIRRTLGVEGDALTSLPEDHPAAHSLIRRQLDADLSAAITAIGASGVEAEVLREELGARYRAWLSYLVSTLGAAPELPDDLRVIGFDEPWACPAGGWPDDVLVVASPVTRETLLAPSSRDSVDGALQNAIGDLA